MSDFIDDPKLEQVWNTTPMGMAFVTADGIIEAANPFLCEFLGYGPGELEGKHFQDVTIGKDLARDLENFQKLVDGEIDSYTMHKMYRPLLEAPRPGKLIVRRTSFRNGTGTLLMYGMVLPLNVFEAAGVTKVEQKDLLAKAVGELIIKNWRVWLPIVAILLGVSNLDKLLELLQK